MADLASASIIKWLASRSEEIGNFFLDDLPVVIAAKMQSIWEAVS